MKSSRLARCRRTSGSSRTRNISLRMFMAKSISLAKQARHNAALRSGLFRHHHRACGSVRGVQSAIQLSSGSSGQRRRSSDRENTTYCVDHELPLDVPSYFHRVYRFRPCRLHIRHRHLIGFPYRPKGNSCFRIVKKSTMSEHVSSALDGFHRPTQFVCQYEQLVTSFTRFCEAPYLFHLSVCGFAGNSHGMPSVGGSPE